MGVNYREESSPLIFEFLGFLQVEKGCAEKTIYNYFLDLRMFFRYLICMKSLGALDELDQVSIKSVDVNFIREISKQDISSFLIWVAFDRHVRERGRNRKIACLKSFFHYLMDEEHLDKNIMDKVSSVKADKTLPKYLSESEMSELLKVVTDEYWIRDSAIIMLMMVCGLRVSEICSLDQNDILDGAIIVHGKGKKDRTIYFTEEVEDFIDDYLTIRPSVSESALFLSQRKKRFTTRGIQKMVTKYFQKAELSGYSCHKLRHTAATQMLKSGLNIRMIQEILGHESIAVTEVYTHVHNEDIQIKMKTLKKITDL